MAIIQKIMGAMGIKSASKTVKTAKSLATAVAQPNVTSKAIDKKMSADAAQGMAMVNMSGKKAYIAPQIKTYQLPKKSKLTAASGDPGYGGGGRPSFNNAKSLDMDLDQNSSFET